MATSIQPLPAGYSDVNGTIRSLNSRTANTPVTVNGTTYGPQAGTSVFAPVIAPVSAQPSLASVVNQATTAAPTPSSTSADTSAPPGVTTTGAITTPVTPVAASSPTQTTPSCNALLQSVLNSLASGGNAASSGTGSGVGADDTSLPSPTTADVEALQPTAVPTSSSGPNIGLIIGVVLVLALGVYLWYRYKKGHSE